MKMKLDSFELDFRKTSGQDSEMKMGQFVELSKSGFCLVPKLVLTGRRGPSSASIQAG